MARLFVWRPPLGGLLGALVFFAASLMPSLLPRPWLVQGVVSGLAAALGYGIGSAIDALLRRHSDRTDLSRVPPVLRRALSALAALFVLGAIAVHWRWRADLRRLMDMEGSVALYLLAAVPAAVGVGYLLLLAGRAVRRVVGAYRRVLRRFLPPVGALLVVTLTVIAATVATIDLLILDRLFLVLDEAYLESTLEFDTDVAQPISSARSGGPGSLIAWETIGSQGRTFVAGGPDVSELEAFHSEPGQVPIRVYAGLRTAATIGERAELAAADLERAGAFEREVLVLVATTGTGWVDPYAVDPLEYMYNGDTAAVAVQYSHRPSWLVMIGNQDLAVEASRELFEAVTRRLEQRPTEERPRFLLYGESLGSFGLEAIFDDLADVRSRSDGALWVGPPRSNPIWASLMADRRPDSPVWRPVYQDGSKVRFGADGAALSSVESTWEAPRVAYLQHASDPITWLSLDLLFRRPRWLEEPRGPDVSRYMPYIPVVTFWQMAVDLAMGTNAPIGHGHKFGPAQAEAWALIVPPPGWTPDDTRRLRTILEQEVVAGAE